MTRDPFDLAGQHADENDQKHRDTIERNEAKARYAWLMSGPIGRRIVADLLEVTGVNQSSFSTNGSQMCFAEGRREVGLRLLRTVRDASPVNFIKMLEEQNERDSN